MRFARHLTARTLALLAQNMRKIYNLVILSVAKDLLLFLRPTGAASEARDSPSAQDSLRL